MQRIASSLAKRTPVKLGTRQPAPSHFPQLAATGVRGDTGSTCACCGRHAQTPAAGIHTSANSTHAPSSEAAGRDDLMSKQEIEGSSGADELSKEADDRFWKGLGQQPPISVLDESGIGLVRRRLANAEKKSVPTYLKFKYRKQETSTAAVLVALCTVNGKVSVLFEERNNKLSSHSGEVCFAGGKADPTDTSLEHTALRETYEEIGIASEDVRVIGKLPPIPNYNFTMRVFPIVGVVGSSRLDLQSLNVNKTEVHRVFALPLEHFLDPKNRSAVPFRNTKVMIPSYKSDKPGLRIWGLTAFILHEFLRRIADPNNDTAPVSAPSL